MYSAVQERPGVVNSKRKRQEPKGDPKGQEFPRVARALRGLREDHKLTQEDMAPVLGLTFAGYRPYERGERDLTQSQIEMIAKALDVPVFEIARRLWPEDQRLVEMRFSHEWDELQKQTEGLPDEIREQVLRSFLESVAILHSASGLARRN